jgi:hypothetical protein
MSRQEYIDRYLSKWASRKLIVFTVASAGLFVKSIESGDWVIIAVTYMSVEGAISIAKEIYKARANG